MPGGLCVFNASWLHREAYKLWLSSTLNKHKAKCTACNKEFDIGTQGEYALKLHMKGKFLTLLL